MSISVDVNVLADPLVLYGFVRHTLVAVASSISIQRIPQTATHLMFRVQGRSTRINTEDAIVMRFNGDAGGNYDYQSLSASLTTIAAGELFGVTAMTVGVLSAANAPAGVASCIEVVILNYASGNFQKTVETYFTNKRSTSTGGIEIGSRCMFWRSAVPVTQIDLLSANGANFDVGTIVSLAGT